MFKVKFTFSRKIKPRQKEEENIPLIFTYHPSIKCLSKIINKNLCLLYMNDEVKRVFSPAVMISFRSARKFSNYHVKLKSIPKYTKMKEKPENFTSLITQKVYKTNQWLNCYNKCSIYLLTCKKCFKQYVGETTEMFCKRWYNYKNNARKFFREVNCIQEHMLEHFQSPRLSSFVVGFCITFIDKADPFIPTKREDSKFHIKRNNNKVNSIETRHIIIAHLLPWSD